MTDLDEKLSYLLDDHGGDDATAAIDDAIADVNLQYRMRRYRMIGEVMRHELPEAIDTGFNQAVMARIREESREVAPPAADEATPVSSLLNWASFKPFAGLALAASVALVTVALWQPLQQETNAVEDQLVSADQEMIEQIADSLGQANAVPASLGMRWKVEGDAPALQQKLNAYLVNHTEHANSFQGLIPQARVAGFDAQQ